MTPDILHFVMALAAIFAAYRTAMRYFATEEAKRRGADDFAVLERKFYEHQARTNAAIEDHKQKTEIAHDALATVVNGIREHVGAGTVASFIGKRRGT